MADGGEKRLMTTNDGLSTAPARQGIDATVAAATMTSFVVTASVTMLAVSGSIYVVRHPIQAGRRLAGIGMRLAGIRTRHTLLDGKPVPYYEYGPREGTPMILIHGLGDAAETWAGVMRALVRMYPDRWVLAPDVPGLGFAPRPRGSPTITTITKSVLNFLDTLHIDRAILAGNSTGGQIALRLAARYPERVARVIAIDPTGLWRGHAVDFRPQTRSEAQRFLSQVLSKAPNVPGFILEDVVRTARVEHIVQFISSYDQTRDNLDAGGNESDLARLARSNMPITLIFGAADRLLPAQTQEWFREALPRAEMVVFDDAGHTPQIEAPGELAALLAERAVESQVVAVR
jgi:pimeloyl-ACP methyl ester carboxylesterase